MPRNQLRFIKKVLYQLRQRYGAKVEYYRFIGSIVNDETGETVNTKQKIDIKKIIRLPDDRTRGFKYDLSFIAANKNFTMGGTYDKSMRDFILDRKYLPSGFTPRVDDYIVVNEEVRYNIKQVVELDDEQGYFLTAQATESETPDRIIEKSLSSPMSITSGVTT